MLFALAGVTFVVWGISADVASPDTKLTESDAAMKRSHPNYELPSPNRKE